MPRKKDPPQPLIALKDPFIASLNHFVDQAMLLHAAVRGALDTEGAVNEGAAKVLRERMDALDAAMFFREED